MRNHESRRNITIVTVVAFLLLLVFVFDFYRVVQKNNLTVQHQALKSITDTSSEFTREHLLRGLGTLETMASLIDGPIQDHVALLRRAASQEDQFTSMGLLTGDGLLISLSGSGTVWEDVTDRPYIQTLMETRTSVLYPLEETLPTGEIAVALAVPVLREDGSLLGAVHGITGLNAFCNYAGAGHTHHVVDAQGTYILNDGDGTEKSIYSHTFFRNGEDARTTISSQMGRGLHFTADMLYHEVPSIVCFSPIGDTGWYTMAVFSNEMLCDHLDGLLSRELFVLLAQVLCTFSLVSGVIIHYLLQESRQEHTYEVKLRKRLFADLLGVVEADLTDDRVLHCTDAITLPGDQGAPWDDFLRRHAQEQINPEYHDYLYSAMTRQNLLDYYKNEGNRMELEYQTLMEIGGQWRCFNIDLEEQDNGHLHVFLALHCIDARKRRELALRELSERDSLTHLYLRGAATDRVDAILRQQKYLGASHAFIILDLDHFKPLNDTMGHRAGDQALCDVAHTLTDCFRKEDVVCRLGGDEFVVFAPNIPLETAIQKAETMLLALHHTYEENGVSVTVTACAGLALAPVHGTSFQELYQHADKALYQAKTDGTSSLRIYKPDTL